MTSLGIAWRDRSVYDWLATRPLQAFAWELLRRNPGYLAAWSRARSTQIRQERVPGLHTIKVQPHEFKPAEWGLLGPYEDPTLDARYANIFWTVRGCSSVLPVIAIANGVTAVADALTRIGHSCRISVYDDGLGAQHILFCRDGYNLQLEVRGNSILLADRLLPDVLSYASAKRVRAARQLADLLTHFTLRPQLYPRERRARRLIEVLQALDGELAGAARRDIAIAMFGFERVHADWRFSRSLRAKVHNAVKAGEALMAGGYLKLLK